MPFLSFQTEDVIVAGTPLCSGLLPGANGADPCAYLSSFITSDSLAHPLEVGSAKILVVDGEARVRDILARVLRQHQYQVHAVSNGEAALESLRSRHCDVLLADIQLPGLNGFQLMARAREMHPGLLAVLMTEGGIEIMRQAIRGGASDFIPKPFALEAIPVIVERNLERRALEEQRAESQDQAVMFSAVQLMAAAIDAKEPYTAQHSRRVGILAEQIAKYLQLSSTQQKIVELAAQVHDVGKIGTPDSVLCKSGELNEAEWKLIQRHPVQGAEIVAQVPQLACVADVVRHHHERIDGRGYPDGLRGEAIPFEARLIAVADAYEVMTSDRVYRAQLPHEEALRRLQDVAGTQFDPAVVQVMLHLPLDALQQNAAEK